MLRRNLLLSAIVLLACALYINVNASSNTIQADVNVICPFYLSLNIQPLYVWGSTINPSYTVYSQALCSVPSVDGSFTLSYANNSTIAYSIPLNFGPLSPSPPMEFSTYPINTLGLRTGEYIATVAFSTFDVSNSSSKNLLLVRNAEITLTSFSVSSSLSVGSPITFSATLLNSGQLASNATAIHIAITGPQRYDISEPVPGLSPNQTEQMAFTLYNLTGTAGVYNATANALYSSSNAPLISSQLKSVYFIVRPPSPSPVANSLNASLSVSSEPSVINFASLNLKFAISTTSNTMSNASISVVNTTLTAPSAPASLSLLSAFNYSITSQVNTTTSVTIGYDCSLPGASVAPYMLKNGTWIPILPFSVDAPACTLTFAISSDPMIAIFTNSLYLIVSPPSNGSGSAGSPLPPVPVTSMPQISFTEFPFFTELQPGPVSISDIGIKNPTGIPENITLQSLGSLTKLLSLSATNVALLPGQSIIIQALFGSQGLTPGVYTVPINITVQYAGQKATRTQYLTYSVESKTSDATATRQISSVLNNATVQLRLTASNSSSLSNATLVTMLPPLIITSASQIKTFGLPSRVSIVNGTPQIDWFVPYLPAGQTVTVSYTILNPLSTGLLELSQNLLVIPSKVQPSSIMRVTNIYAPTFYTESQNRVGVDVLYTGTQVQNVTFKLSSESQAAIEYSTQTVEAVPNELMMRTFNITTTNNTGTLLLSLVVSTNGANLNYSIPIVILTKPVIPVTTTIPPASPSYLINTGEIIDATAVILALIALSLIFNSFSKGRREKRHSPEREKELIRVREQIKRSDEETRPQEHES